ncbi:MAG: hypothetical protein ACLQVI_33040 [Polyangiaceae bacterium]
MSQRVTHATVVDLLALTLGGEKGQSTWHDAVRGLSIPVGESYTQEQAMLVLQALSSAPGATGLAARVARLRLASPGRASSPSTDSFVAVAAPAGATAPPPRAAVAPAVTAEAEPPSRVPSSRQRLKSVDLPPSGLGTIDLLPFLAPSLGEDKAAESLEQYAKPLKLNTASLTRDDAVAILDAMSTAAGLLGVVARFAKVRLLLKYP